MANTNCLEGIQCPKCGSFEPFRITGYAMFVVYDEGSSEFSALQWDDDAHCVCVNCEYYGMVKDFYAKT